MSIHHLAEEEYIEQSLAVESMMANGMPKEDASFIALCTREKVLNTPSKRNSL